MSNDVSLKNIIVYWKEKYGVDWTSPKGNTMRVIPIEGRKELIAILFNTLIEKLSYTKDDFGTYVKNQIIESCSNPKHKNKQKKADWEDIVGREFDQIFVNFFPPVDSFVEPERSKWESESRPMPEVKSRPEELPEDLRKFVDPDNIDQIRNLQEPTKKSKLEPLDFEAIRKNDNVLYDVEDEELAKALGLKDE